MTLIEHEANVKKLIEECLAKGVDPHKVEVFATHGASGACGELSHGFLRNITGNETSGPVIEMAEGTAYIDFYIGN